MKKLNRKQMAAVALCAVVLIAAVIMLVGPCTSKKTVPTPAPVAQQEQPVVAPIPAPLRHHTVAKGEFLMEIAPKYGVGWEEILLANEEFLKNSYEAACKGHKEKEEQKLEKANKKSAKGRGGLPGKGKKGKRVAAKKSYFCNEKYNRPYGNTLLPGWVITVPAKSAPPMISAIVANIVGKRVALVVDDTGSMNNDIAEVGQFYMAAVREAGKELVGVWLFADGVVRKYDAGGVRFLTQGNFENTYGALSAAAKESPDVIILVTDEPGDDWNWKETKKLPPVVGHCLPEDGRYLCERNLTLVAQDTGGRYVQGIKSMAAQK